MMPSERARNEIPLDASVRIDPKFRELLDNIHTLKACGTSLSDVDPATIGVPTDELVVMRAIFNAVEGSRSCKEQQDAIVDERLVSPAATFRERFANQSHVVFEWIFAFLASIYATLVKAKPFILLLKFVLVTVVSVFIYLSTSIPRAVDGHKKLCNLSFVSNSAICASYANINLTVLDLRRPGYKKLYSASEDLLVWSDELRFNAVESNELKTQITLASQMGVIALPSAEDIAGKLGKLDFKLRRAAEGARNASAEVVRFLDNLLYDQSTLVKRIEIVHSCAKNSFISRATFGALVPNFSEDVIKMFEQTHEVTYASIIKLIEKIERLKTLVILCQGDANTLSDIIGKELVQLKTEVNTHNAKGAFGRLYARLAYAMDSKNSALEWEAREEQLDDVDDMTEDALEAIENMLRVLNETLEEMENIRKYARVPVAVGSQMPVEMQLEIAKDMSSFGEARPDLGAANTIV